jgi:hypothetical protein
MQFLENDDAYGYRVGSVDFYGLTNHSMTDSGYRIGELEPIDNADLTPGDPSPAGRTPDGELAYPEHLDYTYTRLSRVEAARLAFLQAQAMGVTELPTYPLKTDDQMLLMTLMGSAVPTVFFEDSNHGQMAKAEAQHAVLKGEFDKLPDMLKAALGAPEEADEAA